MTVTIAYKYNGQQDQVAIAVTGKGVGPEINVKEGSQDIADGAWARDFKKVGVGSPEEVEFTIENKDSNHTLEITGKIIVSGTDEGHFRVSQPWPTKLTDERPTFKVTFEPKSLGKKTAVLSIPNNDADENPYKIHLKGEGELASLSAGAGHEVFIESSRILNTALLVRYDNGDVLRRGFGAGFNRERDTATINPNGYRLSKKDLSPWTWIGRYTTSLNKKILDVSTLSSHGAVVVLCADNTVYYMGARDNEPKEMTGLEGAISVAAGYDRIYALKSDGILYHVKPIRNSNGSYRYSTHAHWNFDSKIKTMSLSVYYLPYHYNWLVGLTTEGKLWSYGDVTRKLPGGRYNQIHNTDFPYQPYSYKEHPTPRNAKKAVCLGPAHPPGAITANGQLWTQGLSRDYSMGQRQKRTSLNTAFITGQIVPLGRVELPTRVTAAVSTNHWSAALGVDGKIYEWGLASRGHRNRFKNVWKEPKLTHEP